MEIASTGRVSGHIKTDWLIIAKGGVFTGNVTELEGLFILLPVRTVIRPEGPGWTRLRALTLSHAVGPNRLPQLTPPRKPAGFDVPGVDAMGRRLRLHAGRRCCPPESLPSGAG